jgi:hypothetical protein
MSSRKFSALWVHRAKCCVAIAAMTATTHSRGATERMRWQKPQALAICIIVSASKARANAAPTLQSRVLATCCSGSWDRWYASDTSQQPWTLTHASAQQSKPRFASSLAVHEFRHHNLRAPCRELRQRPLLGFVRHPVGLAARFLTILPMKRYGRPPPPRKRSRALSESR